MGYRDVVNRPQEIVDLRNGDRFFERNIVKESGVLGKGILIGNILLYASVHANTGFAYYDVNDITKPVLRGVSERISSYESHIHGHHVILASSSSASDGFGGGSKGINIVDFSDPGNIKRVGRFNQISGDPRYSQCQDEFIFVGAAKIDIKSMKVVETFEGVQPVDFVLPLGNLVVIGERKSDRVKVFAHQKNPDSRGPFVAFHSPADGEKQVHHYNSRIGVVIHETLDTLTIQNKQTFLVRPIVDGRRGEPLDGILTLNDADILTFTPTQSDGSLGLQDNTTYEVSMPAGGIQDVAGNGIDGFRFVFATGSTIAAIDDHENSPSGVQPPRDLRFLR
jgi:hypothetical protein